MKNNNNNNGRFNKEVSSVCSHGTAVMAWERALCPLADKTYQTLLESAPDAMLFINDRGKIVFINEQVENLFGYSREELFDQHIEILIPQRYRIQHEKARRKYLEYPQARKMGSGLELYGLKKDGTEFPVDISLSPFMTREGSFITAAIRDISERKKSEEKIRKSFQIQSAISSILNIALEKISLEDQLRHSLDVILSLSVLPLQSKGCIYLVEDERDILIMKAEKGLSEIHKNACARVPFGRCLCGHAASHSEIVFADCISDCQETNSHTVLSHGQYCIPIMSSGKHVFGVINLFLKDGYKRDEESETFLSAVADALAGIIEHKKTVIEKQELLEQLIQSEKLSALGRMTANVAHEIRNPLTALGGFARQLNKRISQGTKEKEYAEVIINEVERLERILGNVLTFSKDKPLERSLNNVTIIIEESLKTFEWMFKEYSIEVEKRYNIVPYVYVDRDKIREVIDNLLTNAIDSMSRGGTVQITIDREYLDNYIYAIVKITDTGEGISEHILKTIFEPFYTTKATGGGNGTGLGLSIVKKIMEQHGGFIKTDSTKGLGTTFSLNFPCCQVNTPQHYPHTANRVRCDKDEALLYCEVQ